MTFTKAFVLISVTGTILAFVGAFLGTVLGLLLPEHYLSVFLVPPDEDVSAVRLGAQLGMIQGFQAGLLIGLLVVVPAAWRRSLAAKRSGVARGRMTRKGKFLLASLLVAAIIAAVPLGFFILFVVASAGMDSGSPKLATVWGNTLRKYNTPDAAAARIPGLAVMRFDNGQWAFGLAQNSHGAWFHGGGTVVVRDSDGDVRAFFGHVCGAGALPHGYSRQPSLDAFYVKLKKKGFVEHDLLLSAPPRLRASTSPQG